LQSSDCGEFLQSLDVNDLVRQWESKLSFSHDPGENLQIDAVID
jgi:hypothetical protein